MSDMVGYDEDGADGYGCVNDVDTLVSGVPPMELLV